MPTSPTRATFAPRQVFGRRERALCSPTARIVEAAAIRPRALCGLIACGDGNEEGDDDGGNDGGDDDDDDDGGDDGERAENAASDASATAASSPSSAAISRASARALAIKRQADDDDDDARKIRAFGRQ